MLKNLVFFTFLLFSVVAMRAQNLVPNFSFEQYDTCPNMEDQIHFATGWSKYSSNSTPDNTTPDYYNACSPDTLLGVPKSIAGFQYAHRNCNAYVGLATYSTGYPNFREHIGIQLSSPLVIGQKYFLSFYSVMGGDVLQGGYYFCMPSDKIGMRLSTVQFNESNPVPIDNFTHLSLQTIQYDTLNWVRISGSIMADSAYQYLILGNFFDDSNTDTVHWNCPECQNVFGYSLIDDVCISTDSILANGGIDAMSCALSVPEADTDVVINIFPNPTSDILNINFRDIFEGEIILHDLFGRVIYTDKLKGDNILLSLSSLHRGTYILKIMSKNNTNYCVKKIVKI